MSTWFKICIIIIFFNRYYKIDILYDFAVLWIDSIFLVRRKPTPNKDKISKPHFNTMQMSSAIAKQLKVAAPIQTQYLGTEQNTPH